VDSIATTSKEMQETEYKDLEKELESLNEQISKVQDLLKRGYDNRGINSKSC
jgi:hypothetical protein